MKRRINIILTAIISVVLIVISVVIFNKSYIRLWESLGDLWNSLRFYFCGLFKLPYSVTPTVTELSEVFGWKDYIPENIEELKTETASYFTVLVSKNNFLSYLSVIGKYAGNLSKAIVLLLPCIIAVVALFKRLYGRDNNDYNEDTKPLRIFKSIEKISYMPVKRLIQGFIEYIKERKAIWIIWLVIVISDLNIISVALEFFAYYFYFAMSFNVFTIYTQFCKLVIDLSVLLKYFPWWCVGIVAWIIFCKFREKIGTGTLRHYEAKNCGFISDLPLVSMTCGSMGKKKTTMLTDMTLSEEVMLRQKALEILQNNDMKFPFFPWICLEKEIQVCMKYKTVYNLATVKQWIKKKKARFMRHGCSEKQLYGYDCCRYGVRYYNGLKVENLFDVLETYLLAYFVYVIQSSLIVSNYSIRTDNRFITNDNFPVWATDFFNEKKTKGRYSHVLDFDVLRLGKKVIEDNPNIGSFEFGVVAITEVGKERGNNLELKEVKKSTDETNQKNDLFNSWLKMCRHSATIDNYPFIKVFTDEQRPESWGSDCRDLCDIINIVSSSKQKISLPFYTIEEMISEWAFNKFIDIYYDFRFRRGDNTFLVYVLKKITAYLWQRNVKVYNRFGYSVLKIEKERGTMDGKVENKKYYIMNQKIYSKRFGTDCFSDYFNDMAGKSKVGLNDYLEYKTEKASVEELKMQNSYFIRGLYK